MFVQRTRPPRPSFFSYRSGRSSSTQPPSLVSQDSSGGHSSLAPASLRTLDPDDHRQSHIHYDISEGESSNVYAPHDARPFGPSHLSSSDVLHNKMSSFVPIASGPSIDLEPYSIVPEEPHQWISSAIPGTLTESPYTEIVPNLSLHESDSPVVLYDRVTPPDRTTVSRLNRILAEATLPPVRLPFPPLEEREEASNRFPDLMSLWNPHSSASLVKPSVESSSHNSFLHSDSNVIPTHEQLSEAASMSVLSENGTPINFGSLWADQKTIVIFTRRSRFLGGQDYLTSIFSSLSPDALRQASVKLVIICHGVPKMIKAYRSIFHQSIEIYADQTQQVHNALGMAFEPPDSKQTSVSGERTRRRSIPEYVRTVMKTSLEMSGNLTQLGGEFVLGPGLRCSFAHRTKTRILHHPVFQVAEAAGVTVASGGNVVSQSSGLSAESSWIAEMAESSSRVGHVGQMPLLYRKRRATARESGHSRDIEEVALLPGGMPGIASRASEEDDARLRFCGNNLESELEGLETWEDFGGIDTSISRRSVDRLRSASAPQRTTLYPFTKP